MSETIHPALHGVAKHTYNPGQGKLTLAGITELPRQVFDIADDIKILDISNTGICRLPDDFSKLLQLEIFFASCSGFRDVPRQLGDCPKLTTIGMQSCGITDLPGVSLPTSLQALILTDNALTALPDTIGELQDLRKLTLSGNAITELPESLQNCTKLEFIRLPVNQLSKEPVGLFEHPSLSWYADSSNPYSPRHAAAPSTVEWDKLLIGTLLSSNRKNEVYAAALRTTGQQVAVKLFGAAVSADGYAEDELRANLTLSTPGVVRVTGAPGDRLALMMPLLDGRLKNLGDPPTLYTVTRDTYPPGKTFSSLQVTTILSLVARQLAHMHSKFIMHGDIYAHNILYDQADTCHVTDFGAASIYAKSSAHQRERIDVQAFGHLANEIASRCPDVPNRLTDIIQACKQPIVHHRPSFADLAEELAD